MRERLRFGVTNPRVPVSLPVVALAGATYTAVTLTDTGGNRHQTRSISVTPRSCFARSWGTNPPPGPRRGATRPHPNPIEAMRS
jgi:hypothetical protein